MIERTTHQPTDEIAVFLIGMRFNRLWRPDAWVPAFFAMPRMLRELSKDRASGLLGYRLLFGERGVTVVQYWRDVESIYAYANDAGREHRPAWTTFYATAKRVPGAVGIWHETYHLAGAESFYGSMPPTGLAKAVGVIPVTARNRTARARMQA